MSNAYSISKLDDLCDILDKKRKPITKKDRKPGPYPYYGATGILDHVEDYIFNESLVLIGEDGAKWGVGERTAFSVDGKYWVNNHAHVIRPYRDKVLDSWVIYYLNTTDLSPFITGLTVPKLNQGKLKEIPIPVPLVAEQKRIVAILDEAFAGIDAAIANTEKNLANARELFESYLNSVFTQRGEGWEERTLSDYAMSVSTGPFGSLLHKSDYVSDGVPLVNPINIHGENIIPNENKLIDETTRQRLDKYILKNGDVVIARRGEIGRCAAISKEHDGWVCGTGCFFIRPKSELNPNFLANLIRSSLYRKQLENVATGATMKNLSNKALGNLLIAIPTIEEQEGILNKVDELTRETQRLESIYQQKLNTLNELKQSLLQKAFSGELTSDNKVVAFPGSKVAKNADLFSPEFTAKILAFAYHRHAAKKRHKTFGHVKAQKTLHLVESIGGIDLDRHPIKDAAGPNDFQHMLRAEEWAKANQFFEFVSRGEGKGYDFKKLVRYDELIAGIFATLKPYQQRLEQVIDLIIPKKSRETELIATVHAAWNNLILDDCEITDEAILWEARENWHADKMKIPLAEFQQAISFIRDKKIIPDGKAKRVTGQENLF